MSQGWTMWWPTLCPGQPASTTPLAVGDAQLPQAANLCARPPSAIIVSSAGTTQQPQAASPCTLPLVGIIISSAGAAQQPQVASLCAWPPAAVITSPAAVFTSPMATEVFTPAHLTAIHSNRPSSLQGWIWQCCRPVKAHAQTFEL